MITLISPAKTLDFDTEINTQISTGYLFKKESIEIASRLKELSRNDISSLMKLSEKLADINFQRFQMWNSSPDKDLVRQAVFMFKGEVYLGLSPYTLSEGELNFAQSNLRILSGLYGYLKPLDLVQAYRLEMGAKINVGSNKNLYEFWKGKVSLAIESDLKSHESETIINLASTEYSKAAALKTIKADVITPIFKDFKNGNYKVISFFAKKARGVMARWIIQNEVNNPKELIQFAELGYAFNESMSTSSEPVFTRE